MTPEERKEHGKLLATKQLFEAILKRHDLCAEILIVGRNQIEILTHLDASWSKIQVEKAPAGIMLRLRSKKQDYPDIDAQRADLEATSGMVRALAEIYVDHAEMWAQISKVIDDATGAEHTPLKPLEEDEP